MEVSNLKNVYNCIFERENEYCQTVSLNDSIFANDLAAAYDIASDILKKINNTILLNENPFELVSLKRNGIFCNRDEVKKMKETLKYTKVREVKSPVRGTPVAGGIDFFVPTNIDKNTMDSKCDVTGCNPQITYDENGNLMQIVLNPGESVMIPSGIKMRVPDGHALVFMNKSGIGAKKQLDRLAELVDCDYEGEVCLNVVNNGNKPQTINAGDKIIQGVIIPVNFAMPEEVENEEILYKNSNSMRKQGGFGSTGNS